MAEPDPPSPPAVGDAPQDHGLPELAPDIVEQEHGDEFDNIIPTASYGKLRVVGLGGSAGGMAALEEFFTAMPPDTGISFVVILHLAPEHDSFLAELFQRWTSMPVRQVQGRLKIEPDQVYVIPPAKHLSMNGDHLELSDMARPATRHVAVDLFFRTLADTHGPHSAAVVLSGADGDGVIGLKRVKERGGITIVQDPDEAEHDGMPRSAIATGLVDWVLPVAQIPGKLIEYWAVESRLQLPEMTAPGPESKLAPTSDGSLPDSVETTLHDLLGFLRVRTGHDFTYYKRATVLRRIGRRMQVHGLEDPQDYLRLIRSHPTEPDALLRDLLISVTNFFRDRDAFAALEATLPVIFRRRKPDDVVRAWVAGCATGEEAYSVAMLLLEQAAELDHPPLLQVFATDLDARAIQQARDGAYPETIAADVSEERLRRFFRKEHGGYRINREVREIVLFAEHDLLKDSPFSRLDLVTCRNLLIYLNSDAQRRALDIFHFALRSEGLLFLGSSESVDEENSRYTPLDKKRRIYERGMGTREGGFVLTQPGALPRAMLRPAPPAGRAQPAGTLPLSLSENLPLSPSVARFPVALPTSSWSDLHYEFMEQLGPPSVLVNQDHQVVHVSESAGRFLQVGGGNVSTGVLHLVHPMLRLELRAALYRARQSGQKEEVQGVPVELDGQRREVNLRVVPARFTKLNYLLIAFEEVAAASQTTPSTALPAGRAESVTWQMERELEVTRAQLRNVIEQADANQEELKASNEELQAMNEELRSAGEELETGREELQSINEELTTVNSELKSKVEELARSNSDLHNLMAATQIATIFLDRRLCIQRYTASAVPLFRLIPSDVGRPLDDLTPRLNYANLKEDAERALEQLAVSEVEVTHHDGHHFLARMLPYRTVDNVIAGVVITFVDISRVRQAEEELRASEARFRTVSNVVPDLLYSTDAEGRLLWCNQRWVEYTGQTLAQAQGFGWMDAVYPEDRARVQQSFVAAVERDESYRSEHRLMRADGQARWFLVRAAPLRDDQGRTAQWFGAKADIDDFKRASADLSGSEERLRLLLESAREFAIFSTDLDLRVTSWNSGAERLLGYEEGEILGHSSALIFTPEDRAAGGPEQEAKQAIAEGRAADERWHLRKDGSRFWGSGAMMAMRDMEGKNIGFVKILRDQTEARGTREALERSRSELQAALGEAERARAETEAASRAKDHFLAVLSHELRTPLVPVTLAAHLLGRHKDLPAAAREAVAMIQRNVQVETRLIDDLLDVTRISRGKLEIVPAPMDLHEAVRGALEISADDVQTKQQRLTVDLQARETVVQGDLNRLQQVFWNLLKNASKFTPPEGEIRVVSRGEPGRVVVEISDTGIGFEPQAAERIFDPFIQAGESITRRFGGLGLGLAISKATVDAHGGTLRAQSGGENRGATFTVTLPLGGC